MIVAVAVVAVAVVGSVAAAVVFVVAVVVVVVVVVDDDVVEVTGSVAADEDFVASVVGVGVTIVWDSVVIGVGKGSSVFVDEDWDDDAVVAVFRTVLPGVGTGSFVISFIAAELGCGDPVPNDVSVVRSTDVFVAVFGPVITAGENDDGVGIELGVICGFSVADACVCDVREIFSSADCVVASCSVVGRVVGMVEGVLTSLEDTASVSEGTVGETGGRETVVCEVSGVRLGIAFVSVSALGVADSVVVVVLVVASVVVVVVAAGETDTVPGVAADVVVNGVSEVMLIVASPDVIGGIDSVELIFVLNPVPSVDSSAVVVVTLRIGMVVP